MSNLLPFLLEIGVEEIPHWMLEDALASLQTNFTSLLEANRIAPTELKLDATPRRLVLRAAALPVRQDDREELVMGPPKAAGEGAAQGFARKQGLDPAALRIETTPKGEYFAAIKKVEGREIRSILAEAIPDLIAKIPWPKAMYWTGKQGVRFIRPIRWLVALFGDQIVECEIAGVKAGSLSRGHRQLGADEIAFDHANYEERLRKNGVILSVAERKKRILDGIKKLLKGTGLTLIPDEALLNDLAYLTEFPTPILGEFDEKFLSLPAEVLTTVMRHHQRYFTVKGSDGKLAPRFIAVTNTKGDKKGIIRKGNERVLEARFNDGRFFWEFDQQKPLRDRVHDLKAVTFQAKLGNYHEKTQGIVSGARRLADRLKVNVEPIVRAAELCKTDLTCEMVKEFTELQGVIGGLYALAQGESPLVAQAIYEHYQPVSMEAPIPSSTEGQVLALADKLDTLEGCFAIGLIPSGSKDPFALRRAAQGVVKILVEGRLDLDLKQTIVDGTEETNRVIRGNDTRRPDGRLEATAQLLDFLLDRARYYFRDVKGFAYDEVNAALAGEWSSLADLQDRLFALQQVRQTENFEPLAAAFKRIRNILKQSGTGAALVDPALLEPGAETELHHEAQQTLAAVRSLRASADYIQALLAIAQLRPHVDKFFDQVLVNAPDEKVKANRLALLARLNAEVSAIADFSEIVTANP